MIRVIRLSPIRYGIQSARYSPTVRQECRITPGLEFDRPRRAWCGYIDAVAVAAKRIQASGVPIDTRVLQKSEVPALPPFDEVSLRDYQIEGVRFLLEHAAEGCLLADSMGIGKSAQALRAAQALRNHTLVVCPAIARMMWTREAAKWWPEATPILLSGTRPPPAPFTADPPLLPEGPALLIIHYEILHAWAQALNEIELTLILDEVHLHLMSDKSRRSKAVRAISVEAPCRVALSGTPMTGRPRDLWNVIDTLCPGRMGVRSPFPFFYRYCDAKKEQVTLERTALITTGSSHEEELRERMTYFMLRRTKTDVALELPPKTRQVLEVEVEHNYVANVATALGSDSAMRKALDQAADGKLEDVLKLAIGHLEEDQQIVVFTHRRRIAEVLCEDLLNAGYKAEFIHGGMALKERERIVAAPPQAICCTIDSTGVAISFAHASVAIFAELDWVPSKLLQAEDRLHRFLQQNPVLIQYVIALGTADELIAAGCIGKLATFEQVIGKTDDGLRGSLEGEEKSDMDILRDLYNRLTAEGTDDEKTRADTDHDTGASAGLVRGAVSPD